ncbi:MAG: M15 family metallopeptidase, partial [Clostridia bacterium]|nr:M15 family metallopeptidase [Clostridia bacterium]
KAAVLPAHSGKITLSSENEGALCFPESVTVTLGGETVFESIHIKINTTAVIAAAYNPIHFAGGVIVECDMSIEENGLYLVGGLNRAGGGVCTKNTSIRLESGIFSRVVGFSRYCEGREDRGHASLFVGGSAYVRYVVCGPMGESERGGSAELEISGDAVIEAVHLGGARKENVLEGDVTLRVLGGDVYRFDATALVAVGGKKNLIFDPDKVFDGMLFMADLIGFDSIYTTTGKNVAAEKEISADTAFVLDGAKGSGLSFNDPTGSLERAFRIVEGGGTIVLCGPVTPDINTVDYFGSEPDAFQEPCHSGRIKMTCIHGGIDYRSAGAMLYFPKTMDYRMAGELELEDMVIGCADGASLRLVARYNELYIGENCKTPENCSLDIIGGFMKFCHNDLDGLEIDDPMLNIVCRKRPLPRDYDIPAPAFLKVAPEKRLQKEAAEAFDAMFDAMRAEGLKIPLIQDTQRPYYKQYALFSGFIGNHRRVYGYSFDKAKEIVLRSCAFPGTSEHYYGVAMDMHDPDLTQFGGKKHHYYDITPEWAWIKENGAKYGIVLRYAADKVGITGFIYEAWHFRYVGKDAARVLNARNITLEEYVGAKYGLFHKNSRVTVKSGCYNSITAFSRNTGYIQLTGRHFLEIGENVTVKCTQKEASEC